MAKAFVDVTITPVGTESASVHDYVVASEKVLRNSLEKRLPERKGDIVYEINPMSTTLEGELSDIMPIVQEMHEEVFRQGASRVMSSIRIDERRDKNQSMKDVVEEVRELAGL